MALPVMSSQVWQMGFFHIFPSNFIWNMVLDRYGYIWIHLDECWASWLRGEFLSHLGILKDRGSIWFPIECCWADVRQCDCAAFFRLCAGDGDRLFADLVLDAVLPKVIDFSTCKISWCRVCEPLWTVLPPEPRLSSCREECQDNENLSALLKTEVCCKARRLG